MSKTYNAIKCFFTETKYERRLLYLFHTTLVNLCNPVDRIEYVIPLSDNIVYMRSLLKGLNDNMDMRDQVYIEDGFYDSETPFYYRKEIEIHAPIKHSRFYAKYICMSVSLSKNPTSPQKQFIYKLNRGEIILQGKDGNPPSSIPPISRYSTRIITLEEINRISS